jgi:hypothetical protein
MTIIIIKKYKIAELSSFEASNQGRLLVNGQNQGLD